MTAVLSSTLQHLTLDSESMTKGFFALSKINRLNPVKARLPKCGICGLYKQCHSPKMPPTGKGKKKILIVAEAPGWQEDQKNTQLIGAAGQRLRRVLSSLGIDLDYDCWKTNAIICRPPENKKPTNEQINACRPNLFKTIKKYNPNVIICLGGVAVESLIGAMWKDGVGAITRWTGQVIPGQTPNAWVVPTWHPSFINRQEEPALNILFKRHLHRAIIQCTSKPQLIGDYKSKIEIEMRPSIAAKAIRGIRKANMPIAFDYETTCLKPERKGARIISCSVSNGEITIAFPWHGNAITEMVKLLKSPIPKIAANAKFEERWSRIHAGGCVRNWQWCTMLAAHILDNRKAVTSLKFQALVQFGIPSYDQQIKPYMKIGKDGLNQLPSMHLGDLLLYNGLDSFFTWKLAQLQMRKVL